PQDRSDRGAGAPGAAGGEGGRVSPRPSRCGGGARGGGDLDLQPHRALPGGGPSRRGREHRARDARERGPDEADRARIGDLLPPQLRGSASPIPGHRGARVDGRPLFVANRRRTRAISLAKRYGGQSMSFDELPVALQRADIVVAATSSPHLLVEARELAEVMEERGGSSMLIVDLAVPRDIDPS